MFLLHCNMNWGMPVVAETRTLSMPTKNPDLSGLWLSPFVVAARLPILWFESLNPDPGSRTETNRMVSEKLAAVQEGMLAAQVTLGMAMTENAAAMIFGRVPQSTPRNTTEAMMNAVLAPAARTVKANVRRLGKKRKAQ
jgi:hypothetical protein